MTQSVPDSYLIDQKEKFDTSKGILDRSKNWKIPHKVSGWLDQFLTTT